MASLSEQLGDWYPVLKHVVESEGFKKLGKRLTSEYSNYDVYPEKKNIFRAFTLCQFKDLKVVILGQDPYHDGSATGLAFANEKVDAPMSPSLGIIQRELDNDYTAWYEEMGVGPLPAFFMPLHLRTWAKQGVLLLNTALTVREREPGSHLDLWLPFTQRVLNTIVREKMGEGIIFVAWGKKAQKFITDDMRDFHNVIEAPHPAAEIYAGGKAGFYGSRPFSQINNLLNMMDKPEINFLWMKEDS